jgi:hypothetical protein
MAAEWTGRVRRGHQFCITVSPVELYDSVRSEFLSYFQFVNSYCIGLEKHHLSRDYHLHAWIEFLHGYTINQVKHLFLFWFEGTVNVQSCKSSRNWLKYITKEDDDPL